MANTWPARVRAGRAAMTGETAQQALEGLRRLKPGLPPIPDAASDDQAFLEAAFLEGIGRCDVDRWVRHMVPFAVRSVTPFPDELIVRTPLDFLPDILRQVMPCWAADEESDDYAEVHGIAGLRGRHARARIVLERPGFPGRIAIPATRNQWRKAALVAADMCGDPRDVRMPWLDRPAEWHRAEIGFTGSWPERFVPGGQLYGSSLLASQVLRRLPGLCPRPRAVFHSLWINRFSRFSIQFEWENGPAHAAILERLLHPLLGVSGQIEPGDGQTVADCYSEQARYVTVRSTVQPSTEIVLRRLLSDGTTATPETVFAHRRDARLAAEEKHGYRVTQR